MSTAADKRALAKAAAGESLRRTALRRAAMYTSPGVPRDVLAGLSAPLRFEGGGLAAALAFAAPGSPNFAALIVELLDLTRANMRAVYEAAPGWGGWRDGKKRGELLDADSRFIVARGEGPAGGGGGALLGFACFRFLLDGERDVLYLFELQLAEAAQRKGLGRHLMLLCEQVARAAGMQRCGSARSRAPFARVFYPPPPPPSLPPFSPVWS
jgi:GNAT superfamily N-acetyltransferase